MQFEVQGLGRRKFFTKEALKLHFTGNELQQKLAMKRCKSLMSTYKRDARNERELQKQIDQYAAEQKQQQAITKSKRKKSKKTTSTTSAATTSKRSSTTNNKHSSVTNNKSPSTTTTKTTTPAQNSDEECNTESDNVPMKRKYKRKQKVSFLKIHTQ